MTPDEFEALPTEIKSLYKSANDLMAKVGAEGEITINTYSNSVNDLMDVLFEIDDGNPYA
jgi:hypothetical protein